VSRRTVGTIVAICGALLIVALYVLLARGIGISRTQRAALHDQSALLETALAEQQRGALVPATRQAELATLQAQLASVQFAFPSEVDSTEVLAHVLATASAHDVTLRQVQARDPVTSTLGTGTYRVFSYDVEAEGELADIAAFLGALESGSIETLMLDQVRLQARPTTTPAVMVQPGPEPPAASAGAPTLYSASVVVQVYVRLAEPGTTPLPPAGTATSPEERIGELEALLEQARADEDWERAISVLLVLREVDPSNPLRNVQLVEAYVHEGQRRLAAGQYEQAGTDFRAALALEPGNAAALAGLAVLEGLTPTVTPTASATPTPTLTPVRLPYYVLHLSLGPNTRYPDLDCQWFGFAGRVTDVSGYPIGGIRVRIWTAGWDGAWTTTSSSGEYEQYLDNHPRAERWLVQLYEGDVAVSPAASVDSRAQCDAALIRLDWQRSH
jgi:tetratricopeptide (TPR) repeat protein